jgi:hypothetical protein
MQTQADVAVRLACHLRISFGEKKTRRIFSFAFRFLGLIDAVVLTGIPSHQIR